MNAQLIPVFNGTIANETTLLVNARDLHTFLGVGKRFASWITERIAEYGFVENQDYILVSPNREIKGRGGDRRSKDYHLTLDTAKETAMVERNEKGRQIRRYFIECEKRLRQHYLCGKFTPHSSCAIVIGHWQNPVPGLASRITKRRIHRASGFFMRIARPHSYYGGLCGGTERCAGSF